MGGELMETDEKPAGGCVPAAPQREHEWLQKMVGEWTSEGECTTEPGKPPEQFRGTESVRSLGGLWVVAEGQGEMPGCGTATTILTLGFDPQRKRYTGTFIGSMMTHLWVYDGALDAAERSLALEVEGPSMAGDGTMAKYKDVIELKSNDHRTLSSHILTDDGKWQNFMTAHYRRKK
jgi:hypothetical protein